MARYKVGSPKHYCPICKETRKTYVTDSREVEFGRRRRRLCTTCKNRFTTYELAVPPYMSIEDFRIQAGQVAEMKKTAEKGLATLLGKLHTV